MSRLTRDGTAKAVSRDQILRHERGQGNIHFPCSADHVQDWQPYPVDPYSCYICDHTYIHTYIISIVGVLLLLLLFLTFSVLVANPKKTTLLHDGQSHSWSAEQGKENKRKSLAAYPPPPHPPHCSFGEKLNKGVNKSRDASTGATQVSVGLASVQGYLRLVD